VEAIDALARLPIAGQTALLEAEADTDSMGDDEHAHSLAMTLGEYDVRTASLYLALLRVRAEMFVGRHANAIRAVAEAALERVVLPGPDIAALVRSSRCVCHGWTYPDEPRQAV